MPEFIASRIHPPSAGTGPEATEALAKIVGDLARAYAARRDMSLALEFLRDKFGGSRFWLYGAGTHSEALLACFGDAWREHLAGIIDRAPAGRTHFHGIPVHGIEHAGQGSDEPILVAHLFYEAEMAAALCAAGIDRSRIRHLYLDPDFIELSRQTLPRMDGNPDAVILGSTRYISVADSELARVLDPATTPYLAFDLFDQTEPRPPFTVQSMGKSVDAVVAALRSLNPGLVYLRTTMETNFLAYLVRQVLPDCVLVHELWDFAVVFEDDTLVRWLKFPPAFIEASRLAECWSVRESDLVLSKWGGPQWAELFDDGIGTELFFGGISGGPAPVNPPPAEGPPRLLYAGLLPKPEDLAAMPYDYNFLGRLERLSQAGAATVTILNSGHGRPEADWIYRDYQTRFSQPGIRYSRRVTYDALMGIAAEQDFGWLALDQRDHWDTGKRCIAPMRFTGYIQAGLPVIISQPWSFCIQLVERFSAGIVLQGDGDAEASQALNAADPARLRQGVQALQAYMKAGNDRVLDRLAGLLLKARNRGKNGGL